MTKEQPCGRCKLVDICYKSTLSQDAQVFNILVCRFEQKIDRERTTKAILRILDPKIHSVANKVSKATDEPKEDVYMEVQSVVIEALMKYSMGQQFHPLRWLFGHKYAAVDRWAWKRIREARRMRRELSYDSITLFAIDQSVELSAHILNSAQTNHQIRSMPEEPKTPDEYNTSHEQDYLHDRAMMLIEDGKTLTLEEYRVLRFCLTNSVKAVRLHSHLSEQWPVSRTRVSTLYSSACRRLIDALGMAPSFLAKRGVRVPRSKTAQRRRQLVRTQYASNEGVAHEEEAELLELLKEARATTMDLAWAYGLSYPCVAALKRRKGGSI